MSVSGQSLFNFKNSERSSFSRTSPDLNPIIHNYLQINILKAVAQHSIISRQQPNHSFKKLQP